MTREERLEAEGRRAQQFIHATQEKGRPGYRHAYGTGKPPEAPKGKRAAS